MDGEVARTAGNTRNTRKSADGEVKGREERERGGDGRKDFTWGID